MSPLYDYECPQCQAVFEQMAAMAENQVACEKCAGEAHRVISYRSAYKEDASWVADCTVPFDKSDSRPEVQAYLAHPSDRMALKRAMRATGLRHVESGELEAKRERKQGLSYSEKRELIERNRTRRGEI